MFGMSLQQTPFLPAQARIQDHNASAEGLVPGLPLTRERTGVRRPKESRKMTSRHRDILRSFPRKRESTTKFAKPSFTALGPRLRGDERVR